MKISFVIPAHNEEQMIGQCLSAVFADIERTLSAGKEFDAEVVVVDNASTDKTREVALQFPNVTVVHEPLKGLVYARRAGWVATDGELVANIDADTRMPSRWLERVLGEFANDPELAALSGPYHYYDLPVWKRALVKVFYLLGWLMHLVNHHVLGKGAMLQGGNFVLRRSAWDAAGGFDTSISFYGEDTDVAKRIGQWGKVKWTWALPMHTTGRRLEKEGLVKMSWLYTINHLSILWRGKPATHKYSDIRMDA
jgi:glycosyltransferase involved in cell wall biosynthesis